MSLGSNDPQQYQQQLLAQQAAAGYGMAPPPPRRGGTGIVVLILVVITVLTLAGLAVALLIARETTQAVQETTQDALDSAERSVEGALDSVGEATTGLPVPPADAAVPGSVPGVVVPGTAGAAAGLPGIDADGLPAAVDALRAEIGGPPTLLRLVMLQTGRVEFQVRDPAQPENVDSYPWTGTAFEAPVPVQLVGGGDLDAAVFSLEGVDLTAPVRLQQAADEFGLEGGAVASMVLEVSPFNGLSWSVPVSGTRESKVIQARPDGSVIQVL
jgi:hypothetical protein